MKYDGASSIHYIIPKMLISNKEKDRNIGFNSYKRKQKIILIFILIFIIIILLTIILFLHALKKNQIIIEIK